MTIENVNTIEECRTEIVRNRVFNCNLLPVDKWQLKTLFLDVRRLLRVFLIAAFLCVKGNILFYIENQLQLKLNFSVLHNVNMVWYNFCCLIFVSF